MVKKVSFSMEGMGRGQKVCFSMAEMTSGKKVSFSMSGMCHGTSGIQLGPKHWFPHG
jgi:hypothetical protein